MIKTKILLSARNAFEAFVAKKNRKAVKLECSQIQYSFGNTFFDKVDTGNTYEFIEVFIDESTIRVTGWNIIGRLDDNEGETIIITNFGHDMSAYRDADTKTCDHCKTARNRKAVYIIKESSSNQTMRIGSTCLNDFVGHKSAVQYAQLMSWVGDIEATAETEEWLSFGKDEYCFDVMDVLATAAVAIRENGYISKDKAESLTVTSTADDVKYVLTKKIPIITEADTDMAEAAVEWFNTTTHKDSDYFYNMGKLVNAEYTKMRFIGILVSLIPVYQKAIAVKTVSVKSEYVGNIGDKKVRFDVVCNKITTVHTQFGTSYLYMMTTTEGNAIKYFTKAGFAVEGEEFSFLATIKDHQEYNGFKQTVVTRGKHI